MNENVLSWNLPNFISVALMMVIIWLVFGFGSHLLRGKQAIRGVSANSAGGLT